MNDARLRSALVDYARRLHARGWVANHDGNVSHRLNPGEGGRYLCTPTATSKADVGVDNLLVVDDAGARVAGAAKPFSEIGLHLTVFNNRPDVNAVVHAHPPTATGFAVAGLALDRPFIAEAVVSLGANVPLVPFAPPGAAACAALAPYTTTHDAVLLANHGVMTWGADLEQAYLRMELVEHLCRIAAVALQLGGIRPLPEASVAALLEARRKAGLGLAASRAGAAGGGAGGSGGSGGGEAASTGAGAAPRAVVACAPPPPGSDVVLVEERRERRPAPAAAPNAEDLATIIRQELMNALKQG